MSIKVTAYMCEKCPIPHEMYELMNPDYESFRRSYGVDESKQAVWYFSMLAEDGQKR
jgi:hypothetical protein